MLLLLNIPAGLAQENSYETKIKAVFLYNFTRYFEWPEQAQFTEFRIGLLTNDSSFKEELRKISLKKKVGKDSIRLVELSDPNNIPELEMLYVDILKYPNFKISQVKKRTLVVNYGGKDLYNTMIAFVEQDTKLKFAFNAFLTNKSQVKYHPDFEVLAIAVVRDEKLHALNNQQMAKWADVLDKLKNSSDKKEVTLTQGELEQVLKKYDSQNKEIESNQRAIKSQGELLLQQTSEIQTQEAKIRHQVSEMTIQTKKIDEQLNAISQQEQKLNQIKSSLDLTIAQNEAKQHELTVSKQEISAQKKRMQKQKEVLASQKKDIDLQSGKLIKQLDEISTQKTIIWLSLILVVLIVFSLAFVYRNYKRTRKINALLETQKEEITQQNTLITIQKHLVEEKQKEITDSINYAQRIQSALLASDKLLQENLKNYFVFFQPKDIVSGDFYWGASLKNNQFIFVTADSTGHGVPGAIMSMLNISSLEKAVNTGLTDPSEILNFARKKIIETLANDGSAEGGKDGMDCSLISVDLKTNTLSCALANNPVWIIRNNSELIELEPDKMPVGKHVRDSISFKSQSMDLQKGDLVYTLTDGLPDQFGGPKSKKFMYKKLKELLLANSSLPLAEQKTALENAF